MPKKKKAFCRRLVTFTVLPVRQHRHVSETSLASTRYPDIQGHIWLAHNRVHNRTYRRASEIQDHIMYSISLFTDLLCYNIPEN